MIIQCAIPDNERKELNAMLRKCYAILNKKELAETTKEVNLILNKLNKIFARANQLELQFD